MLKEDNRAGALEARWVSYVVPKFHELWSTNALEPDRSFYTHLTILFGPGPSNTLYAALTWRHTATLNETLLGSSAAQI